MDHRLVAALRSRGVTVVTVLESRMSEKTDEEQLAFAAARGLAVYTGNISDFHRLHLKWATAGREHCGMILIQQQRYSVGEQLRRILRMRASITAELLRNKVEFLSNWG